MDPNKKRWIVEQILVLLQSLKYPEETPSSNLNEWKYAILSSNICNQSSLKRVCNDLLRRRSWGERFSADFVEDKLIRLVATFWGGDLPDAEALGSGIDNLVTELDNYADTITVYIPLVGVTLPSYVRAIELGRVVLLNMDADALAAIQSNLEAAPYPSSVSAESHQQHVQIVIGELTQQVGGLVCAKISVIADPRKAVMLAEAECEKVFDILRYSISFLYSKSVRITIGTRSRVTRGHQSFMIPIIMPDGEVRATSGWVGVATDLELSARNLQDMVAHGAFHLAEILKKPQLTAFEQTLLSAVHWFASAQTEMTPEYEFLSLMISLETIFTQGPTEPIAISIADGVALLGGADLAARKQLRKRVRDLYDKRSKIAHEGQANISEQDAADLLNIVLTVLMHLIDRCDDFLDKGRLAAWIEDQKFSHFLPGDPRIMSFRQPQIFKETYMKYVDLGPPAPGAELLVFFDENRSRKASDPEVLSEGADVSSEHSDETQG